MSDTVTIENKMSHDRKFFGISVNFPNEGTTFISKKKLAYLNKNSPLFQELTRPPKNGEPEILVGGSTPDGQVKVNCSNLDQPTMINAPKVRLRGNGETEVSEELYEELKKDKKFQRLRDAGEIVVKGED